MTRVRRRRGAVLPERVGTTLAGPAGRRGGMESPAPPGSAAQGWLPPARSLVTFGASTAAVVAGGYLGSLAKDAEQKLDDCLSDLPCGTAPTVQRELQERASRRALQANIAYGVALAGLGVGIWLWLSEDAEAKPAGVRYGPLGVTWRF